MKELNIPAKITVCSYDELSNIEKNLIDLAKKASNRSYAPYKGYRFSSTGGR